jgi:hypothetical protein
MGMRRQIAFSEVDAPAIEELAAGPDRHEHRRVTLLGDSNAPGCTSECHASPDAQAFAMATP